MRFVREAYTNALEVVADTRHVEAFIAAVSALECLLVKNINRKFITKNDIKIVTEVYVS